MCLFLKFLLFFKIVLKTKYFISISSTEKFHMNWVDLLAIKNYIFLIHFFYIQFA